MKRATDRDVLLLRGAADTTRLAVLRDVRGGDTALVDDLNTADPRHLRESGDKSPDVV